MCPDSEEDVPADRLYRALSHPTRRALVRSLRGADATTVARAAADLAETDAASAASAGGIESDGGSDRVEVLLHHAHLPKLADHGLIEYDPETGTIRTDGDLAAAASLLDRLPDPDGEG